MHVDQAMMQELVDIKKAVNPQEILLVVDGMSGQDALTVAGEFEKQTAFNGFILTKMDGDTRGGAALSIKEVTGRPIKFISQGEGFGQFDCFYPDRLASRILGRGDVVSLVEKAQASLDQEAASQLEEKLRKQQFTLEDFLVQLKQIKKMGPVSGLLELLPGMGSKAVKGLKNVDGKSFARLEAIILSMTRQERRNPVIIDGSRRKRIARGSGTSVQEVNQLLKQYKGIEKLFKMFGKQGALKRGMSLPFAL
jgi:signal recognition particle subunit SRP54